MKATFLLGLITLLTPALADQKECRNEKTRWDYWWYGVSDIQKCAPGQHCHLHETHGKETSWSVTAGLDIGFDIAKGASAGFNSAYSYSESYTDEVEFEWEWDGPGDMRLWIKKWFAVTDAECHTFRFDCHLGVGNYCDRVDGPWKPTTWWVPCTNGDCIEHEVSDAYGKCDAESHCQQN